VSWIVGGRADEEHQMGAQRAMLTEADREEISCAIAEQLEGKVIAARGSCALRDAREIDAVQARAVKPPTTSISPASGAGVRDGCGDVPDCDDQPSGDHQRMPPAPSKVPSCNAHHPPHRNPHRRHRSSTPTNHRSRAAGRWS
jgi:hypothetical protein